MKDGTFQHLIFQYKMCDKAERYDDMVENMKMAMRLAHEQQIPIDCDTRNYFSVAYKNIAGARRSSYRILTTERQKQENCEDLQFQTLSDYITKIGFELKSICDDAIQVLDRYILTAQSVVENPELHVFFLKMKGDYYRYKAEVERGEELDSSVRESGMAYESAMDRASLLQTTSPVKLGLALNFSVFYYEILGQYDKACYLARTAFDDAIADLDKLKEEYYKDSTLIMQLLRDNLTLWTNKQSDQDINDAPEMDDVGKE